MRLTIEHNTHYRYAHEVRHSTQYLRLTPQLSSRQRILSWELDLPQSATCTTDSYGNILHVLTLDQPHEAIHIHARGVVEIQDELEDVQEGGLSPLIYLRHSYLTQPDAALRHLAAEYHDPSDSMAALQRLMTAIRNHMPYTPGSTDATYSASEAYAARRGVCQDHTHVFLTCCRTNGIPARYVSGYIYSPDSTHVATHAWAEAWLEDGWHTFDVTNNSVRPNQHLKLAVGMDYLDACPVRGVRIGGGDEAMDCIASVSKLAGSQ